MCTRTELFHHKYTSAAAVHLILRVCQWRNTKTFPLAPSDLPRNSDCVALPLQHKSGRSLLRLTYKAVRALYRVPAAAPQSPHTSRLRSHPSACSQFPQSCLRKCRECMRLSRVAHFTRWSDWIRCNSLYFHSHSPLGGSKVP